MHRREDGPPHGAPCALGIRKAIVCLGLEPRANMSNCVPGRHGPTQMVRTDVILFTIGSHATLLTSCSRNLRKLGDPSQHISGDSEEIGCTDNSIRRLLL